MHDNKPVERKQDQTPDSTLLFAMGPQQGTINDCSLLADSRWYRRLQGDAAASLHDGFRLILYLEDGSWEWEKVNLCHPSRRAGLCAGIQGLLGPPVVY